MKSFSEQKLIWFENDNKLVLSENYPNFLTYEATLGIYVFKDLSEVPLRNLQLEHEGVNNTVDIEYDDISMKFKLVLGPGIIAIRFDEKSIFSTVLDFNSYWDYKHYSDYISLKNYNFRYNK